MRDKWNFSPFILVIWIATVYGFNYYFNSFWWPFTKFWSSNTFVSIWKAHITLTGWMHITLSSSFIWFWITKAHIKKKQKCLHLTDTKIAARIDFHMKNNAILCYIIWSAARKLHWMRILYPKFQQKQQKTATKIR